MDPHWPRDPSSNPSPEAEPGAGLPLPEPAPETPTAAALLRLAPHVLGRVRRGIVGSSRYAVNLREAIRQAAHDPEAGPVLISGEPGLEKDNIAALVHYGSAARQQLLLRFNAALLRADGAELFDAHGGSPPLLELLGGGGLLIDQLDRCPPVLRERLLELARTGLWNAAGDAPGVRRPFRGRLFFTTEESVAGFEGVARSIRVPPLRVRRQDLGEWMGYCIRQRARSLGWEPAPRVNGALVKRLQAYDFPGNLRELAQICDRALRQCEASRPAVLPEEVFWISRRSGGPRFELWRWKPQLRNWMRSPRLWNTLLFGPVSWFFVLVNLWLWLGPQTRQANGALNLFWAWWWPVILLSYPLVGRLWCSFCPFMVWGEISQRLARALGLRPARWPRGDHDRWAAPLLAAGFALILIWEAVWDLPDTAWLSSCLLLLITGGAVIGSLLFEKRFWCRYLCPVGGMNGLFSKLAISELRAQVGICAGSCGSYACFKGGPAEGEGLATAGCPLGTHPAHLADNRNCVLCLTCAQACPHRSVTLRLRPPAADLQREMTPPLGELALILVLAGGVLLHHWQPLLGWLPLAPEQLHSGPLLSRLGSAGLALALPGLVWLLLRHGPGLAVPARSLRLGTYALLPLLWAVMLADHLPLGMGEAGRLLPVSLAPLAAARLPWASDRLDLNRGLASVQAWAESLQWQADPHVIGFCQSLAVLVGAVASLVLLRRLLPLAWRAWLLQAGALALLALSSRWLLAR
ncbi:MAG: 4Fe-4S binding protein [Synechococcaceae cyanobacterium]|nr:4Fe-4S binding protein [Synechococcaceae cyanobacterium]